MFGLQSSRNTPTGNSELSHKNKAEFSYSFISLRHAEGLLGGSVVKDIYRQGKKVPRVANKP